MELAKAIDFARQRLHGVLVTARRDGRPQLSNVAYHAGDDAAVTRVPFEPQGADVRTIT